MLRYAGAYTDSASWSLSSWLDHQWRPRLCLEVGLTAGYELMDPGTDMTNQRLEGRVRGLIEEKLSYSIQDGVEFRQFLDTEVPLGLSPIVNGSLDYQVFEATSVGVYASHDTGTSYYEDQFTETTSLGGSFRKRLLGKLSLSLSGGYLLQIYRSTVVGDQVEREDNSPSFTASLSTGFLKWGDVLVFTDGARTSRTRPDTPTTATKSNSSCRMGCEEETIPVFGRRRRAARARAPGLGRVRSLLRAAARSRVLVVGDVMLDQFVWGWVSRISPEALVPVVECERESLMPGGAANVAYNPTALGAHALLAGVTGLDASARDLRSLLEGGRLHRVGGR